MRVLVEETFTAAGTSSVLETPGKEPVNVLLSFTGAGYVKVEESYQDAAGNWGTWYKSRDFTEDCACSFRNHEQAVRFRFNCTHTAGSVYCRMSV